MLKLQRTCAKAKKKKMKLTWKNEKSKTTNKRALSNYPNLPFDHGDTAASSRDEDAAKESVSGGVSDLADAQKLSDNFLSQGNKLAEYGKYREALSKWEAAITLTPERAVIHEQKAQILLEIGDAWNALKTATRATELEPSWAEAWITLGRAQLNFGEPDNAIESFDKALAIKPDSMETQDDRKMALHLVKKRKLLHLSGLSSTENRYVVGDQVENT